MAVHRADDSRQLPGAPTSVGPHSHCVIPRNRQSPPTIKNKPASTFQMLHSQITFSIQPPAINKVPPLKKKYSISSAACCVSYHICLSSLITVLPVVYFIWAETAFLPTFHVGIIVTSSFGVPVTCIF